MISPSLRSAILPSLDPDLCNYLVTWIHAASMTRQDGRRRTERKNEFRSIRSPLNHAKHRDGTRDGSVDRGGAGGD